MIGCVSSFSISFSILSCTSTVGDPCGVVLLFVLLNTLFYQHFFRKSISFGQSYPSFTLLDT